MHRELPIKNTKITKVSGAVLKIPDPELKSSHIPNITVVGVVFCPRLRTNSLDKITLIKLVICIIFSKFRIEGSNLYFL